MGRQNKARRKQKRKQKQSSPSVRSKKPSTLDEVMILCEPVSFSLMDWEFPPSSIMKSFDQLSLSPAGNKLRVLLTGFLNYLFHDHDATGDIKTLKAFRQDMRRGRMGWFYAVLFIYCLISEQSSAEENLEASPQHLDTKQLEKEFGFRSAPAIEAFLAPYYLYFWLIGRPLAPQVNLRKWLRHWLLQSPLHHLIGPLEKLLRLKQPNIRHKAVQKLEQALGQVDLDSDRQWRDALSRLLTLFLHQRLSTRQQNSEAWGSFPKLRALAGFVETAGASGWSQLTIAKTDSTSMSKLNHWIDSNTMDYPERLQLEALKCRILSLLSLSDDIHVRDFQLHFGRLINLLCTGVPPEGKQTAERCLDITCQWLADQAGKGRPPPFNIDQLLKIHRRRKDDYRVAILIFVARNGRSDKGTNSPAFTHIHAGLFIRGLTILSETKHFLDVFYWPLSSEIRKSLFISCCRHIFLGTMNSEDMSLFWQDWRTAFAAPDREPFVAISKGSACESEVLFYGALALINDGSLDGLVHTNHVAALLRFGADLLTRNTSHFNQQQTLTLLKALTNAKYCDFLFDAWEPVQVILNKSDKAELEGFLLLALHQLSLRPDRFSDQYNDFYQICRGFPKLRTYLPHKSGQTIQPKRKKSIFSQTLDLFGD